MHSLSEPRTLLLTERVPHVARLAPVDVAFLLEHHRAHVEVLPTGRRDRYRLTALGCTGVLGDADVPAGDPPEDSPSEPLRHARSARARTRRAR